MILQFPHNFYCETFKRDNIQLNNEVLQIMEETRNRLEASNYRAVIISIIK